MPEENKKSIKQMLAIMSGKGGVGKSVVTALLAIGLQRRGQRVGILDADLACPSIAHMFGATAQDMQSEERDAEPLQSRNGIKMTSMDTFLEREDEPLAWRGPMVSSAMKQFYSEIHWGELDFLLVDVPPGTADVPMTVLQWLPLDGVVIVSTPQVSARKVVQKCVNLVLQNNKQIIGAVEDMSTFTTSSGEQLALYGESAGRALAAMAQAPLLAQVPMDSSLATLADSGRIEEYSADICETLADSLLKTLASRQ